MKKWLIRSAAALGMVGLAALAIAQVPALFIASPTGLEQINVLVPSTGVIVTNPDISTITVNQIRNADGYILVAAGTTVSTPMPNTAAMALATGAITTWNLTLPTAPYDGENALVGCPGGNVGTLSITATAPSGVAIVGANPTSCTEATPTSARFEYSLSANTWYRVS